MYVLQNSADIKINATPKSLLFFMANPMKNRLPASVIEPAERFKVRCQVMLKVQKCTILPGTKAILSLDPHLEANHMTKKQCTTQTSYIKFNYVVFLLFIVNAAQADLLVHSHSVDFWFLQSCCRLEKCGTAPE